MSIKSKFNQNTETRLQAAHDIRAPFAVIKHYLKKENFLNDSIFHSAFERFELLLNELGNSSPKATPTTPTKRSVQEVLFSVIAEKQMLLTVDRARNIKLTENLIDEVDAIHAPGFDQDLARILSNLIDNAIEATPSSQEAHIHIELTVSHGSFEISIRDNGIGFPKEVLPLAGKTPFSFNKIGGSGRGLFHARRVIKHLDGDFSVKNIASGGAEVKITLPILH
jgi:signal transduction histidine kinase